MPKMCCVWNLQELKSHLQVECVCVCVCDGESIVVLWFGQEGNINAFCVEFGRVGGS